MVDRSLTGRNEDVIAIELLRERGVDELDERFMEHRAKLRAMVISRLDNHVLECVEVPDVLDQIYARACERLDAYVQDPRLAVLHWLRRLGQQVISALYKEHRDANDALSDSDRSPSLQVWGSDYEQRLASDLSQSMICRSFQLPGENVVATVLEVLAQLPEIDRQILGLRHLEQLTIIESACEIGTTIEAANRRYRQALRQLTQAVRSASEQTA